jgi:hypothetical protein
MPGFVPHIANAMSGARLMYERRHRASYLNGNLALYHAPVNYDVDKCLDARNA